MEINLGPGIYDLNQVVQQIEHNGQIINLTLGYFLQGITYQGQQNVNISKNLDIKCKFQCTCYETYYTNEECKSQDHECFCFNELQSQIDEYYPKDMKIQCRASQHDCQCIYIFKNKINEVNCKSLNHDCICRKEYERCKSDNCECICELKVQGDKRICRQKDNHWCSCKYVGPELCIREEDRHQCICLQGKQKQCKKKCEENQFHWQQIIFDQKIKEIISDPIFGVEEYVKEKMIKLFDRQEPVYYKPFNHDKQYSQIRMKEASVRFYKTMHGAYNNYYENEKYDIVSLELCIKNDYDKILNLLEKCHQDYLATLKIRAIQNQLKTKEQDSKFWSKYITQDLMEMF